MLHEEIPLLLHNVDWLELFGSLFNSLENFNKLSPYLEKEDDEDMSWPGVTGNFKFSFGRQNFGSTISPIFE